MNLVNQTSWGTNPETSLPVTPRRWQAECLPKLLAHYRQPAPAPGVISAIMGSGKARMIAQYLACCQLGPREVAVVSAPKIMLVKQLSGTIKDRLDSGFMSGVANVGCFYGDEKDLSSSIIVTCIPSLPLLVERLKQQGRTVALFIQDECHRGEIKTVHDAVDAMQPRHMLGFTATPFLTNAKRSLSLYKVLIDKLTADDALRDKIVVWFKIHNWEGSENTDITLNEACYQMTKDAVGPGLFNAVSIEDAENLALWFQQRGRKVEAVHSKLSEKELDRRMNDLKYGRLWAVTHVHLLVEGVDAPYLRFLCLRKPMSSRVAFVQQLGRLLRADPRNPDKTVAHIYDPHDLMSVFSITPEEALGGVAELDDDGKELSDGERMVQELMFGAEEVMKHVSKVKAGKMPLDVKPLQTYLTTLVNAFDVCGLIDRKILARHWRTNPATQKQAQAISNMNWASTLRCVPRVHQRALGLLTGKLEQSEDKGRYALALNRGTASDLASILFSLADEKRRKWPDIKNLDSAASDGIAKTEERAKRVTITKPESGVASVVKKKVVPALEQGVFFDNKRSGGF